MSEESSTPIAVEQLSTDTLKAVLRDFGESFVDKAKDLVELDDDGHLKVKDDYPESNHWTVIVKWRKEGRRFFQYTFEADDVTVPTDENSTYVFEDDGSIVACFAAQHVMSVMRGKAH